MERATDSYEATFADVTDEHDYYAEIEIAERLQIIPLSFGLNFRPDQPLTRADAAAMLRRFADIERFEGDYVGMDREIERIVIRNGPGDDLAFRLRADALMVRNRVETTPRGLQQGDRVRIWSSGDSVRYLSASGDVSQDEILARLVDTVDGVLTSQQIAAIVTGRYADVAEEIRPQAIEQMMEMGLQPDEAEAIMDGQWGDLPSLAQDRLIQVLAGQIGVPSDMLNDLISQDSQAFRDRAEQFITEALLANLLSS